MEMESGTSQDAYHKRMEWIAVILVAISLIMMMYSYSIFSDDADWGQVVVALNTATAVVLLLSVVFSVFGKTALSRIALGTGVLAFIIVVIALGIKLMQRISDYGGYY